MKNVKLEIRKLSKAGFSLVEMLVVIAVIGIIAAIAIPNIGSVNDSAKEATARRNAQSVASMAAAAQASGYSFATATVDGIYADLSSGVTPTTGAFSGNTIKVPNLPTDTNDSNRIKSYLTYQNGILEYKGNTRNQ